MIASRIGRAATRFGPTRFGGSSSAIIGSAIAHSSSGTRQIGGNGCRSFLRFAILHLRLSTRCSLYASLEIVTKRNQVKKLADVRLNLLSDCYVSHNRATVELLTWRNSHKNEKGNPTVAGFDGPTWADNLHLDYDNEADPGQALIWLRQGLNWFEAHDVDLRALGIYFSGYK